MGEFFGQPWQIQVALASGYAAYCLSYSGIRHHHSVTEITFATILFGLIATLCLAISPSGHEIASALTAFVATCASAIGWRLAGRDAVKATLRRWDVTWSDDAPSALATLLENRRFPVSQIAVELDDGKWMICEDPSLFQDAPIAPITIGVDGDVALYLTHIQRPGENSKEQATVRDSDLGDRITYIPAARIRQITVRHQKPS